jgi:exopolyphosphatase/guanosine-5'-triphosphate,3'-diphosphate pyrophosphatase
MADDVFAAIDVGSNTIHLLVARWNGTGLVPMDDRSDPLQLGADLELRGAIGGAKLRATAQTIQTYVARAEALGARDVQILATQAVRAARNRPKIVSVLEKASGQRVVVLDPAREAYLAVLATAQTRTWPSPYLVADLGGASTQLVVVHHGALLGFRSEPVGSARLGIRLRHDPPTWREIAAMETRVSQALIPALRALLAGVPLLGGIVAAGGAATRTARLIHHAPPPQEVTLDQLYAASARVYSRSAEAAAAGTGIKPLRIPTVRAGIGVLTELLRVGRLQECTISPFGIREGAILTAAHPVPTHSSWTMAVVEEPAGGSDGSAEAGSRS